LYNNERPQQALNTRYPQGDSRDRQQLIEMCLVVDTVLVDQKAVYSPGNNRLLLDLKGALNETNSTFCATFALGDSSAIVIGVTAPSAPKM
jgi:hypothetical protein